MKLHDCLHCILPIALLLGICHAQEPLGEGLRSFVYDVRDIVRIEPQFLPATAVEASFLPSHADMLDDCGAAVEIADLTTMVREASTPENWEQEGVEIRPEDGGFLSVTCSDAMHTQVRTVLGKLRQLLFESVLVEVHELPGAVLAGRGPVLMTDEIEALLAEAGEHRVHFGRGNLRRPLLLESKRTQNRIAGLAAKVANDSSATEPMVETASYGASWTVRATSTVGDGLLVSVAGSDRVLDPTPVTRRVPTGDGDRGATLELLATRIATCQASAFLRPGQALLVGSSAPDGVVLCVRVQRTGPPASSEIGELTVYPVTSLVRGASRAPEVAVPYEGVMLFPNSDEEPRPAVFDEGRLMEWIKTQVDPAHWDGSPNTMHYLDGKLLVRADAAVQQDIAEQLRSLQALNARQFGLEVRFGEVYADAVRAFRPTDADKLAESLPQRCLAPVSASRGTSISSTRHMPYVRDYDAVIASSAAAIVPRIGSFARGFLLRGNIAPMDGQAVMLDIHLTMLSHTGERSVFELQDLRIGPVDRVDVRENRVRGTTAVELDKWTVLHLAPVEGGSAHVAVVARVRELLAPR